METLLTRYQSLLSSVQLGFERSLSSQINWEARAIGLKGARGTGKSTLMLQQIKKQGDFSKSVYISLDDIYFKKNTLLETSEKLYRNGIRYLYLDEVHKYHDWQREIKNLYDFYPDLKLIISGSSILELQKSSADLSRRVLFYELTSLSFREFLELKYALTLPKFTLEEIQSNHISIAQTIKEKLDSPLSYFREFLEYGAYPYFKEGIADFSYRLQQVVNVIIDYDLPEAKDISVNTQSKLKKLLFIISESVPFTPNISKLATQLETTRPILLEMLYLLEESRLVRNLRSASKGTSLLNKPEKIYISNTSLIHSFSITGRNQGNLRETFAIDQLQNAGYDVSFPKQGDFLVNETHLLEIGGVGKGSSQVSNVENHLIFSDDLEIGWGRKLPLFLLGFLY
ncbi:MAG: AAA family ATPase [Cyclobacteriaceae bacterium]|nr:AAA family ATPase [Cyclobacteriaceae bacterium]MDX5465670.1 AAA family ATPase [Cyclobacteriaceae bacterium]